MVVETPQQNGIAKRLGSWDEWNVWY